MLPDLIRVRAYARGSWFLNRAKMAMTNKRVKLLSLCLFVRMFLCIGSMPVKEGDGVPSGI